VDRSAVLLKVMEVLSRKGFAKASIGDLTTATGLGYSALHRTFGSREEILRAAIRFCAETEASLAHEPLRVSPTAKEAILAMLEENVRLRRHWPRYCDCLFAFNGHVVPPDDAELQEFLTEERRSLSKHIRSRFVQSVTEGELPAGANCEVLANLCLTVLSGLNLRVLDGAPQGLLFRSIEVFVKGLGFTHSRRNARARLPALRRARH
jgi:AcrR family transcriptional regulator